MTRFYNLGGCMGTPSITRELVDLTPKMASEFLNKNAGNRGMSARRVSRLASEIKRGGWVMNGQPIIVDDEGNLLDGQHRCAAVVSADRPVKTLLVRGISRDAFATIDSGRSRSGADVLTANGVACGTKIAAILRLVWRFELGVLDQENAEYSPSNNDIADLVDEYPDVAEAFGYCNKQKHMRCAPVAFLRWATMRGNKAMAEPFWTAVSTGAGLSPTSPALKLRDTLIYNVNTRAKQKASGILAFCLRAWVCYLGGNDVQVLKAGIMAHPGMRNGKDEFIVPMTREQAQAVTYNAVRVREATKKAAR